jgi:outer membrane lipoprotein-sorting protein
VSVAAADVFDHPVEDFDALPLQSPQKISGSFKQERFIVDLNVELHSAGKFSINRGVGILWQTLTPLQSSIIISDTAMCTVTGANQTSVKNSPVLKEFLDVMNAIFSQDFDKTAKHFDVFFEANADGYTVGLRAKSAVMAKSISELTAAGSKYMDKVTFSNTQGDLTVLEFSDISEEAAAFTCE